MCDYSLEMYASRPAQEGEQYHTVRFPTGSIGLMAEGDGSMAVCIACGTRLLFENLPSNLQTLAGVKASEIATFGVVPFGAYRDGVVFANGAKLSLQQIGPGILVSLAPASLRKAAKPVRKPVDQKAARELETV